MWLVVTLLVTCFVSFWIGFICCAILSHGSSADDEAERIMRNFKD